MLTSQENQLKAEGFQGSKGSAHLVEDACALNLGSERRQPFCNVCSVALESKDGEKIHLKGHDVDRGSKCVYCHMTE